MSFKKAYRIQNKSNQLDDIEWGCAKAFREQIEMYLHNRLVVTIMDKSRNSLQKINTKLLDIIYDYDLTK